MNPVIERSLSVFPAACNGEFNLPADQATVISRGEGCQLWTHDGRKLLDFSMGWGSTLPGHARPEIVEAVRAAAERGGNFAYTSDSSLAAAEEIVRVSRAAERVRFCVSGTEATMYCLRLARAYSGRPRMLKFEGAYHGAHDLGVSSLFPAAAPDYPRSEPGSAGVDIAAQGNVLISPFNDAAAAARVIAEHADELGAVIVEPLQRCLPPVPGFLAAVREACTKADVPLIFDEVVTGFRLAYGGAQELYGVTPDLVAYGKAVGGGLPLGVYGGRREIMEWVVEQRLDDCPEAYVWTASTQGGNHLASAASVAALEVYRQPGTYEQLHRLGRYLRDGIQTVLADCGVEGKALGDGPLASLVFTDGQPRDYRSSRHQRPQLARTMMLNLFARDVFINPMGTKFYMSLAHTEAVCDEFCNRLADSLRAALAHPNEVSWPAEAATIA